MNAKSDSSVVRETPTIAFACDLLPSVEDGSKMVTIRKGERKFAEILDVADPSGMLMPYQIRVLAQETYTAKEIPVMDIVMDGFKNRRDMVDGMKLYYPDFGPETECTVVRFELLKPRNESR